MVDQSAPCSQLANNIASVSAATDSPPFHAMMDRALLGERCHQAARFALSVGLTANSMAVVKTEAIGAHGNAGMKNPAMKYRKIIQAMPLFNRVAATYSVRRAVCPAQGIGLPKTTGAARATRPCGRGFLWSGVSRELNSSPFPVGGRPIVARPATRIGLRVVGTSTGVRP